MKNFIEVNKTEEEQVEQIKKFWNDNGMQIIAGVVIGIGAIWGMKFYDQYQSDKSAESRSQYLSIGANNDQAYQLLQNSQGAYKDESSLLMAKYAVESGDYKKALDFLLPLSRSENEFISHAAKLRASNVYLQTNQFEKALSILQGNQNSIFDGLYNHAKGDAYLALNNIDSAKKHYQLALEKISSESDLYNLIQIKLGDLD